MGIVPRIAVMVIVVGCGSSPASMSGSSGIDPTNVSTVSSGDASTSESSSTSDGCPDCGELRCIGGACYGCHTNEDCPDALRCWNDYCRDAAELPQCLQLDAPVCGDGVVEALEECDGSPSCNGCRDAASPRNTTFAEQLDRIVPTTTSAGLIVLGSYNELGRYSDDGESSWTVALDGGQSISLALDDADNAYVVGLRYIGDYAAEVPWVGSWDPDGQARWSIEAADPGAYTGADADATRVLVSGQTEQLNSPTTRALVAQYTTDGTLQWSQKLPAFQRAGAVIVGDEAAVLATGLVFGARTLLRLDSDGVVSWSVDVTLADGGGWSPAGPAADGRGGTWLYGENADGPWLARYDAEGNEIDRVECFAGTAGSVSDVAVGPDGRIAIGILVSDGPIVLGRATPWVAFVDDGVITSGTLLDPAGHATLRILSLTFSADGVLVAGVNETNPNLGHVYRWMR